MLFNEYVYYVPNKYNYIIFYFTLLLLSHELRDRNKSVESTSVSETSDALHSFRKLTMDIFTHDRIWTF